MQTERHLELAQAGLTQGLILEFRYDIESSSP